MEAAGEHNPWAWEKLVFKGAGTGPEVVGINTTCHAYYMPMGNA